MKFEIKISQEAKRIVNELSTKELLNQVLCPFDSCSNDGRGFDDFGSLFFHPSDSETIKPKIDEYKNICKIPPFIVSDFEAGPGIMISDTTHFPSFMALSETGSEELAYEAGKIAAIEAGKLGFNWTFSPVADIVKEATNPIVSTRGASDNIDTVIKIAGAYVKGLQDNKMIATIKHFPGDGFTSHDQHLTTTVNPLSMDEWYKKSGRVFKELIDDGAMCVMPGHISLPAYDDKGLNGIHPPATLSKKMLQNLLRGELGFKGLIVSDAIEMGGAVGYMNYFDACSACIEAGCDVLLFPMINDIFYNEMFMQIEKGNLSLETLRERATRLISLKMQLGLFDDSVEEINYDKSLHLETVKKVVDKSVKIVRDRNNILPFNINKESKILHLGIMNSISEHEKMLEKFTNELKKHVDIVDELLDPGPATIFQKAYSKEYDLIICSIGNKIEYGLNEGVLSGKVARNMMGGWTKLDTPVVFVAHYHPFVHLEFEAQTDTIINTYGNVDYTFERLAKIIFNI